MVVGVVTLGFSKYFTVFFISYAVGDCYLHIIALLHALNNVLGIIIERRVMISISTPPPLSPRNLQPPTIYPWLNLPSVEERVAPDRATRMS